MCERVAFARALANDSPLLLAHAPTGNLAAESGQKAIQILQILKGKGKAIMVSTHDSEIMSLADSRFCLEDGRLARADE